MLMGEYSHSLDTKGRLIMPAKLRQDIGDKFILTKGLDGCLFAFSQTEWNNFEEKLKGLPLSDKNARNFVRFFLSGATECEIDKQGRFLIPTNLRISANLEKDEIIIGVTRYPEKKQTNNQKNTKKVNKKFQKRRKNEENREKYNVGQINKKSKRQDDKYYIQQDEEYNHKNNKKIKKQIDENDPQRIIKRKRRNKVIKIILLTILIISAIIALLLSPVFNIQTIEVVGNKQISKEEIKSLSGIEIYENLFKVINKKVENNIKENAYINTVKVSKKIPDTIHIEVEEREASYMLEYGNGFVYVNNQGYMLEISSIKKELPILIGISTSKEDYKAGNRLNEEDLIKLGTVIKIMNSAQTNGIASLITKIDISNENNYTLFLEKERKTAYLGDCSNLETRMLFLVGILEKEKENPGEIFINMNLNTDDAYFRESV